MMPYFLASSASMKKSRSTSFSIFAERLPGILGEHLVQEGAGLQDMLGADLDIRSLAFGPAERLMDHDFGIRQSEALAFGAG